MGCGRFRRRDDFVRLFKMVWTFTRRARFHRHVRQHQRRGAPDGHANDNTGRDARPRFFHHFSVHQLFQRIGRIGIGGSPRAGLGAINSVLLGGLGTILVVLGSTAIFPEIGKLGRLHELKPVELARATEEELEEKSNA